MDFEISPARYYSAAMDSVNLIHVYLADPPQGISEEEVADTIRRNVEHLKIVVAKDFWTNENLTPFYEAISAGEKQYVTWLAEGNTPEVIEG